MSARDDVALVPDKAPSEFAALHVAAFRGNLRLVKHLVANFADINETDWFGRTPLHFAAAKNRTRVIRYLLKHRARAYEEDCLNRTPRDVALEKGSKKAAQLLL